MLRPIRHLRHSITGINIAEITTLLSLLATLGFILANGLGGKDGGIYANDPTEMEKLQAEIIQNCLTRTRANDYVRAAQAKPYNCFRLDAGNDSITVNSGQNIIFPGSGRDIVQAEAGSTDTEIVYESGNDIYHFRGGAGAIDLGQYRRDEVMFTTALMTPATSPDRSSFDAANRPASDLDIETPAGTITVAGHFSNQPLSRVFFSDTVMRGEKITTAAITDQTTPGIDQVLGTDGNDQISPGGGDDRVTAGPGDDVIFYSSGNDIYDAGLGQDILTLEGTNADRVTLEISPDRADIIVNLPGRGRITLVDQALYPPTSPQTRFARLAFTDATLEGSAILRRAIRDQSVSDDARVTGSRFADVIEILEGIKQIDPGTGNDAIVFRRGEVTIFNTGEDSDRKTLDISSFTLDQLTVVEGPDGAMVIVTPTGRVTIDDQLAIEAETPGVPIDRFRLGDQTITDATFRAKTGISSEVD